MEETLGAVELNNEETKDVQVLQPQLDPVTDSVLTNKINSLLPDTRTIVQIPYISVSGTTSETDVINTTIPGGTLGTTGAIGIHLICANLTTNNSTTVQLKVYYGSTAIADGGALGLTASGISSDRGIVEAVVLANASASAQRGYIMGTLFGDAPNTGWAGGTTASEDSTSDKALRVTATPSDSGANTSIDLIGYLIY